MSEQEEERPGVLRLVTKQDSKASDVIEILRDMLARAERGEVVSVALVATIRPGNISRVQISRTEDPDDMIRLIGQLDVAANFVKQRIVFK
jgi:hypothetical protein